MNSFLMYYYLPGLPLVVEKFSDQWIHSFLLCCLLHTLLLYQGKSRLKLERKLYLLYNFLVGY